MNEHDEAQGLPGFLFGIHEYIPGQEVVIIPKGARVIPAPTASEYIQALFRVEVRKTLDETPKGGE